jgi:hypothetical protein
MEFDLDLEDLDLKSVDMSSTSQNKNISFQNQNQNQNNNQSAFKPTFREQSPNLTISTSNNDSMPSMNGFNSDKEVDFGLNLLVNKKKQRPESEITKLGSNSSNPSPTNKMSSSFSSMFGNGNGNGNGNSNSNNNSSSNSMPQKVNFDDTELLQSSLFDDNMTNIDLDKELNSMDLEDISPPKPSMSGPSLPNFGSSSGSGISGLGNSGFAASATNTFGGSSMGGGNSFGGGNSYGSINTAGISSTENVSFEEIQKRKFDLLCKFERLRDKGIKLPKTFSMSSNYEEMNHEYERLIHHRKMDNSVKMQRRMLVSFASMAEFVNNKTGNPFDIHLDGWSENMNEEINNYDEVFEDLYEKYKESASMAPELKLVFMVASSAFWFHISNNMSKSVMSNMNMGDMFKNNPNLMNQFKEAAMGSMQQNSPGLANFMSMGQGGGGNSNSGPPKYNPMAGPPFSNPRDAPPRGSTNINSSDDIDALIESISN